MEMGQWGIHLPGDSLPAQTWKGRQMSADNNRMGWGGVIALVLLTAILIGEVVLAAGGLNGVAEYSRDHALIHSGQIHILYTGDEMWAKIVGPISNLAVLAAAVVTMILAAYAFCAGYKHLFGGSS